MRPPSATGVGEAYELKGWANCGAATSNSVVSWTIAPLSRSTATTPRVLPSGVAVVSHTRGPTTIGDDQARPWIAVCQVTCSVSDHVSGRPGGATPWPSGPRNCGQSSAAPRRAAPDRHTATTTPATHAARMAASIGPAERLRSDPLTTPETFGNHSGDVWQLLRSGRLTTPETFSNHSGVVSEPLRSRKLATVLLRE